MMETNNCGLKMECEICEVDGITRETDVSLDEMMSLACRQGKLDIVELLLESGAHVDYRNKAGNTPLLEACSQGHVDVAKYLLEHNANIDAPTDTTSDSALTWACTLGNELIVELLLSEKSNVEHRTKDGCTALMFAALAGHVKVAIMLLDHGANINVESDSNKDSPLTFACWKGHVDVVELLLARNGNIEHRTKEGFTPLMFSALGGHTIVAKKLLEKQAKVNEPSGSNNDIPLTSACWKGHHDVVKLLLEYKSNIEHRTKDGCTPLMLAAREGHLIVAQLILDSGALVNVPSGSENNIPLTLACWKGHTDVVELLLDHKSDKEHRNKAGCTPLMLAAREGHLATTKLLLKRGAEVNTPSGSNDDTPLTLACWKGHDEVVRLLLEHLSTVDHQTKTGCTPLMEATREGHVNVVSLLLENAADVELPDNYGQSPLFMACWKGHRDVAELLLRFNANRECRTKTGITPLFQACRENHVSVVELLLDQGASVTASFPNSRENPMTLAAEKGYVELVEVLLSRGGNVDCRTKKGCSPFFLACKEGHLEIARSLYQNSANIEVCDQRNISPLVAAFKNGHHKVVEWILSFAKHVPSEEQCQKCITAPLEGKDNDPNLIYLRTTCYEMIKKAKMVKEQAAFLNAESFLQELEEDKVREENKKKRQAAKRRDKRKKKKKQKGNEQQQNSLSNMETSTTDRTWNDMNDDTCSDEENGLQNSTTLSNHSNAFPEYDSYQNNLKLVNDCRATTIGREISEKNDKNSTEERRDDQPQAVFDANENNGRSSPKKKNHLTPSKSNNVLHPRKKAVQAPTNVEEKPDIETDIFENNCDYFDTSHLNEADEIKAKSDDFLSNDNSVKEKSSPAPRLKSNGQSSFINSWTEVTRNTASKSVVIQLTAPNALCGRVIGRGGTKINSITDESGAQITIGKPDPKTPNDRVITIKGTIKAVQKAKVLVSQALNTPSGIAQTQTPNLSSSPPSVVHSQTFSSVAPIRGNFAAIPSSSSAEWPTVAQANRTSNADHDFKSNSVGDEGVERVKNDTRETRANSAPEIYCETEKPVCNTGQKVWNETVTTILPSTSSLVQPNMACSRIISTAGGNSSGSPNTAKTRTKSYALTQDSNSRLSYCEVATGMENDVYKTGDVNKGCMSDMMGSTTVTTNFYADNLSHDAESNCVEETDNVFSENKTTDNQLVTGGSLPYNDQLMTRNRWTEHKDGSSGTQNGGDHSEVCKRIEIPSSSSLFTSAPWPSQVHHDSDKTRTINWRSQDTCESTDNATPDHSPKTDVSTLSSHSIWSPAQRKSVSVGTSGDGDLVETNTWENSNSASSSRSSSRLELTSIMESDKNVAFTQLSPSDVSKTNDQDNNNDTCNWLPKRGARSAPSSPSPSRTRDQRMRHRPITAQSNSYDDMSERLWSHKSETSVPANWDSGASEVFSDAQSYMCNDSGRDQRSTLVISPKLAATNQYEPRKDNNWTDHSLNRVDIPEVRRLLNRLSLTKYNQTFEDNFITMDKLLGMTDLELQGIGIPKGPRLKIIHALSTGKNGVTNGLPKTIDNVKLSSSSKVPEMLTPVPGAGTFLDHMQMDVNARVPPHNPFASVVPNSSQMIQKPPSESLNHMLLPYLPNSSIHSPHPLLSIDPGGMAGRQQPSIDQQINGFSAQQQQYVMSTPVQSDQYDAQNSYVGQVPYQQPMFYTRPHGPYYYYQ